MQCTKNPGQAFMKHNHFIKYCHNPGEISYPSFSISSNIVTILEKSHILSSPVLHDLRGPDLGPDCLLIKVNKGTDYGWVGNQTLVQQCMSVVI